MAERSQGVSTGYHDIDTILGGGFRAKFVVIAGRPGHGKTALAVSMLANMAQQGNKGALISLEMNSDEIMDRVISYEAQINSTRLAAGYIRDDEWSKILDATDLIYGWPLIIDDTPGGITIAEIKKHCRDLKKRGAKIIFIDQLSKIRGRGDRMFEKNTDIVNQISTLPKELGIPVVLLAQINRTVAQTANKKPSLEALKNTGSLEEDADIVLLVHREYEYTKDPETKRYAEIDIAKHRGGPTGYIEMTWIPEYTRFSDGSGIKA